MKSKGQNSGFRVQGNPWILAAFALLAAISAPAAEPGARESFNTGLQAFAASNYPEAGESFLRAADAAPTAKLDPAAAQYNAALSAYAAGDLEKASARFADAAAGSDLALQAKAYYNRGNALFHLANSPAPAPLAAAQSNALDLGEATLAAAIQSYENAIALNPQDADAKANYELAVLKQQQIQQQKQQQQDQQKQDQQKPDQPNPSDQKQEGQKDQEQKPEQPQPQPAEQQPRPQPNPQDEQQKQEEEPIQDEKPSEEMTPEEAAMMLDAMKAQEQSQRDRLHPFFGRPVPVEKDW